MSLPRFLLRWSWVVVLLTVLGAAGGYAFLLYGPVPYQSSTTLMLRPQADPSGAPLVTANPQRATVSVLALAGQAASPSVYEAVSRALAGQLDISSDEVAALVLNGRIQIVPVGGSNFLTISATDPDPNRAWLLADGYARGFMQDLTAQTRLVSEQQQADLHAQIAVLNQQLTSVPLNFNNPGVGETYAGVHAKIYQTLLDTQARLQAASQMGPPVVRYAETSTPTVSVNEKRVLVAGAAVGATLGLALAYLGELSRQWRRRRVRSRQRHAAAAPSAYPGPAASPAAASRNGHELVDPHYLQEGRPGWAGSARY
jgi:uncharacterized protein involved in exopolysaccharide biosynthesis